MHGCEQSLRRLGVDLIEMNGEDDHVHLLVEYLPTVQISRMVNSLKRFFKLNGATEEHSVSNGSTMRRASLVALLFRSILRMSSIEYNSKLH